MTKIASALLVVLSGLSQIQGAETPPVQPAGDGDLCKIVLRDGRSIEGFYDKSRGMVTLPGKIKMEMAVKESDVVSVEVIGGKKEGDKSDQAASAEALGSLDFTVKILADFERALETEIKENKAWIANARTNMRNLQGPVAQPKWTPSPVTETPEQYKARTDREERERKERERAAQNRAETATSLQTGTEQRTQALQLTYQRWAFARAFRLSLQKHSTLFESFIRDKNVVWAEDPKADSSKIAEVARTRVTELSGQLAKATASVQDWDKRNELVKSSKSSMLKLYFAYYSNLFINANLTQLPKGSMEISDNDAALINDYVSLHRRITEHCKKNKLNVDVRILKVFMGVANMYYPAKKMAAPQDWRAIIQDLRDFRNNNDGEVSQQDLFGISGEDSVDGFDPAGERNEEFGRMKF